MIKRKKIFTFLKSKHYDIVFLQETHLKNEEAGHLCKDGVGQSFSSEGSKNSRGVITLINKHLQFRLIKKITDEDGRILITLAEIRGQDLMLINIYAPNGDNPNFFIKLKRMIQDVGDFPIIMAGDLNVTMDNVLDRSGMTYNRLTRSSQVVKDLCSTLALTDIWRLL